jgi:eukaryotic-like serine/threonine-protein kinase
VWIADHLTLRSRVVVKFMASTLIESDEIRARFAAEAAAASQVKSPHVVQILDYGLTTRGTPYIVMELLEGIDLGRHLLAVDRISLPQAAIVVTHVARALQRAHERGIVHRDIKPENIFLLDTGDDELFAKVLDFGIAKQQHNVIAGNLTKSGYLVGTPFYMSPEQLLQGERADHNADLWALAVVAYESITGERPFEGDTVGNVALAMTRGHIPPSRRIPGVNPEVDAWFARAFARNVAQRFATAREMADALLEATETRLTAPPPSSLARLPTPVSTASRDVPTCEIPTEPIEVDAPTPIMTLAAPSTGQFCAVLSANVLAEAYEYTPAEGREERACLTTAVIRGKRPDHDAARIVAHAVDWYAEVCVAPKRERVVSVPLEETAPARTSLWQRLRSIFS